MKEIKQFDVVILGGGLAGIYTALCLSPKLHIGLFVKDAIERGSSNLAQGGIAAELSLEAEMLKEHFEDTLKAGAYQNKIEATKILVNEAKTNIDKLLALGVEFDRKEDGTLLSTLEG